MMPARSKETDHDSGAQLSNLLRCFFTTKRFSFWWSVALGPAGYLIVALALTWPLALNAHEMIVVGTEPANTVPQFNAWTIWWNADRAVHGFADYWNAPIFYPEKNTFAYSEPQPATVIVAPAIWISHSRAFAMNLYLWLSLALNGWFAERLLRSIVRSPWIAVGGGLSMMLLPIVHWQMGVIQLVPMWGTIWLWWAIIRLGRTELSTASLRRTGMLGLEIGLAMTACWYCCVHHGLSLALLMLAGGFVLLRQITNWKLIVAISVSVVLFAALNGPILWHLSLMTENANFKRTQETVAALSNVPSDYLNIYGRTLFKLPNPQGRAAWMMCPGYGKYILALVGIAFGFGVSRRIATILLTLVAIAAFFLSLGDNLQIFEWKPWWFLVEHVPGFAQIRNVFRFGYFLQAAAVLLATSAIDLIWEHCTRYKSSGTKALGLRLLQILVFAAALYTWFDPFPGKLGLASASYSNFQPSWFNELARQQREYSGGVLCLPMAQGHGVKGYEITAEWMMASTYHRVPLVNGYSGFFPKQYFQLRGQVQGSGMSEIVLRQLVVDGVFWVVIDRKRYNTWWGESLKIGVVRATRTYGDGSDVDIYRLDLVNEN